MPNPRPPVRVSSRPAVLPPGIRSRTDGRYEWRYTDRDGKPKSVATNRTRSLADLVALASGPARIPVAIDRRLTVADYLRIWAAGLTLRSNTVATYRENVERYLVPGLGTRIRLVDLSADHVRALYAELRRRPSRTGRPLAPRTIGIAHATLRKALAQAVRDQRIPTNPALGIDPTGGVAGPVIGDDLPIPGPDVLRTLNERLRGDRLHSLYLVASMTGLRQSEALGLRWSDVDLEGRWIHVRRSLVRTTGKLEDPKTRSSRRIVRLHAYLADALRMRRLAQKVERVAAGDRWANPDELVFTDPDGRPLEGRKVTHWYQRELEAAGLPRYRWHDLRHAYATGMLEQGHPTALVAKSLGHSSEAITADIYMHMTDRMRDDLAETAAARVIGE